MIVNRGTKTRKGLLILSLVAEPGEPVRKVVLNQFLSNHSALPLLLFNEADAIFGKRLV